MFGKKEKKEEVIEEEAEEEETEETKVVKKVKKELTVVVAELPKEDVRQFEDRNKNIVNVVTIEEALTEILEKVRKIDKGLNQ